MIALRPYQEESVTGLFDFFYTHAEGNPIVALPTGTGKSIVIAEFIRRALEWWPRTRILVATHVKELIRQDFNEMLELWPTAPIGIYSAGLKRRDTGMPVTFCGIASIAKKLHEFGHIDLLVVDECHLISHNDMTQYRKAINALKTVNPNLRVIGLTATPFRLGHGLLTEEGGIFTHFSTDYCSMEKFNDLVDAGFISPLHPKKTDIELMTDDVHIQNGEFVAKELQAAVDKESVTRAAITEAIAQAHDRNHWLVFCTGIVHADHTVEMLNKLGVSAVAVHTMLPGGTEERDANIEKFKSGKVRAVVSVGVLTTGFNYKPIDCIVMLRPTMSSSLWIQMLGRGTRPSPDTGKTSCLVLDFAKNTVRLGCINDPVIPKRKGGKGTGMAPFKICKACNCYNHTRAIYCIDCGEQFPIPEFKGSIHASEAELIRRAPKAPKPSVVETYQVTRVEYAIHRSRDASKPPSLKCAYHCGLRIFQTWLCFDHPTPYARHVAHETWRQLSKGAVAPGSTEEAMSRVDQLQLPREIRVLNEGKYSSVVGYEF